MTRSYPLGRKLAAFLRCLVGMALVGALFYYALLGAFEYRVSEWGQGLWFGLALAGAQEAWKNEKLSEHS